MEQPKVTPYRTKSGIQIGQFYERRQIFEASYDMELLQEALLMDGTMLRREKIKNLAYAAAIALMLFLALVIK